MHCKSPYERDEELTAVHEPHMLRLFQLCARLGHDLAAGFRHTERGTTSIAPLSHLFLENCWMDCLAWLVDTYGVSVQGLTHQDGLSWSYGRIHREESNPAAQEWEEELARKLAAIQARQRRAALITAPAA